jgi:hypothetical protein
LYVAQIGTGVASVIVAKENSVKYWCGVGVVPGGAGFSGAGITRGDYVVVKR